VQSGPVGTPRTASRIRGSGCRRHAGARLLLVGDNTFEDGLGIIHCIRLGDLLRVVCDEGGVHLFGGWMNLFVFGLTLTLGPGVNPEGGQRETGHTHTRAGCA